MSSSPPISVSRSITPPSSDFAAQLAEFDSERIYQLQQLRKLPLVGDPETLYAHRFPQATQSQILHFGSLYQRKPKLDQLDAVDQMLSSIPNNVTAPSGSFEPTLYPFRNLPINSSDRQFEFLVCDEQLFRTTGLDINEKYQNRRAKSLLNKLDKVSSTSNAKLKQQSPTELFTLYNALQLGVKSGQALQWLAEETCRLSQELIPNIKDDLASEFADICPQIRTYENKDLEKMLNGLQLFSEKAAYLTTEYEKLLELYFQKHRTDTELLKAVQKTQRCYPMSRKSKSWRRPDQTRNDGMPTVRIVHDIIAPTYSVSSVKVTKENDNNEELKSKPFSTKRSRRNTRQRSKHPRSKSVSRKSSDRSHYFSRRRSYSRSRSNRRTYSRNSKYSRRNSRSVSNRRRNSRSQNRRSFSSARTQPQTLDISPKTNQAQNNTDNKSRRKY